MTCGLEIPFQVRHWGFDEFQNAALAVGDALPNQSLGVAGPVLLDRLDNSLVLKGDFLVISLQDRLERKQLLG